jgi:hypothetical protein
MTKKRRAVRAMRAWETSTRACAHQHARVLAVAIAAGTAAGPQPYDLGIVLDAGERVWHRCLAAYQWRATETWVEQHMTHGGYRSTAREVTATRTYRLGMTDWLITNQRLAARTRDGSTVSIHWDAITGVTVDLAAERVILDGTNGYHGEFLGPAVAPIGVAAIAACHGKNALLDHPALSALRSPSYRLAEHQGRALTIGGRQVHHVNHDGPPA